MLEDFGQKENAASWNRLREKERGYVELTKKALDLTACMGAQGSHVEPTSGFLSGCPCFPGGQVYVIHLQWCPTISIRDRETSCTMLKIHYRCRRHRFSWRNWFHNISSFPKVTHNRLSRVRWEWHEWTDKTLLVHKWLEWKTVQSKLVEQNTCQDTMFRNKNETFWSMCMVPKSRVPWYISLYVHRCID